MSSDNGALTRLNYFNGMRLEATDLRVEQNYHIDVRQRLTRALFSPGIAEGLEVIVSANDPHHVVVRPGLAIDNQGRVIVIDEDQEVLVQGIPSSEPGWVFGNYLTIAYEEEKESDVEDGCKVASACCDMAWGGPTRIVARPLLSFQDAWPDPGTGAIVLGQVELDDSCAVKAVKNGVRKYVTPISSAARAFALEGEREIDSKNWKTLIFHLRGPTRQVMLYLRAFKFSSLFYTELGEHMHPIDFKTQPEGAADAHTHDMVFDNLQSSAPTPHSHVIVGRVNDTEDTSLDLDTGGDFSDLNQQIGFTVSEETEHTHTFDGTLTTEAAGQLDNHRHDVTGDTDPRGQTLEARADGAHFEYIKELAVIVDGADLTPAILNHLGWTELGDGQSNHPLVTIGTPMGIPLDQLGLDPFDGQHVIELRVADGGGTIQYNLYVE